MNKKLYTKVILSTIITGMAASNVIPLYTFAAEQTVQNSVSQQEEDFKNYSLSPDKYKEIIEGIGKNILTMNFYADTILNQQQTDLSKISSINGDLQANMIKHQKDAQTNATYWLDDLHPHIMKTSQNSVSYNETFQASYNQLLAAVDQKDTVKFKNELDKLYNSILKNRQEVDELIEKMKTFRNKMAEDTSRFEEDSNQLMSILRNTNLDISFLQQKIDNCNNIIKENSDKRGGYIALSVFMPPVGIPLIVEADKNIASAQQEIEQLKSKISGAQAEVVILTDAKNKTEHMNVAINPALIALQNMADQWHIIEKKYKTLRDDAGKVDPNSLYFIKSQLNAAKDSWQDLKNYADALYEGVKSIQKGQVEKIDPPIENHWIAID